MFADYKELLDNDAVVKFLKKIITFSEAGPKVLEPLAENLRSKNG